MQIRSMSDWQCATGQTAWKQRAGVHPGTNIMIFSLNFWGWVFFEKFLGRFKCLHMGWHILIERDAHLSKITLARPKKSV